MKSSDLKTLLGRSILICEEAPGFFYCALTALQEVLVTVKVGALTRKMPVG